MVSPDRHAGIPILGNLLEAKNLGQEFYTNLMQNYGDIVEFHYLSNKFYFINHPDYIHRVLTESIFIRSEMVRKLMNSFTGHGLFVLENDAHLKRRRLMQPMFHHKQIRGYAQAMIAHTQLMLNAWQAISHLNFADALTELSLRILVTCLFDADGTAFADELSTALKACQQQLGVEYPIYAILPHNFPVMRFGAANEPFQTIHRITENLITERRKAVHKHEDLLSLLIMAQDEAGASLSDSELHAEILSLLFAGHETAATSITWAAYLLASHPEILQKLQAEIDGVLGTETLRLEHLPHLPYTKMVIDETLRLYPPAWYTERVASEATSFGDYEITPEITLVISVYASHRDPRFFPDPLTFNPERFNAENIGKIPKHSYLPFSEGVHMCIGNHFALMELQIMLAMIVQSYEISLPDDFVLKTSALVTLSIAGGLPLTLRRRTA